MIRAMKLNYQKHSQHQNSDSLGVQTLSAPMIILPGLFGSTRNWRYFATELSKVGDVYVVDQRNHGDSPHAGSHTYADMAADLVEFIDYLGVEAVHLIGHSMGGKASMCCALWYPKRLLSLTVLDIAPVVYEHSHAPFLEAMLKLDVSQLSSRTEADKLLTSAIPEKATRLFLLQSLTGSPGDYSWRLNLQTLHDSLSDIMAFPIAAADVAPSRGIPTTFISGADSNYVQEKQKSVIAEYFANPEYVLIAKAGHWLHVEQPAAVLTAIKSFLIKND